MTARRFWDVTMIWVCASNIQSWIERPSEEWGAWAWLIVITGFAIIISKYFRRDAF